MSPLRFVALVFAVFLSLGPGLSGRARAAPVAKSTVAVMPFRDLTGEKPSIGEALRETVTADLKELSDLRVVERGEIERVVGELKLQAQRTDLDAASASKVGKMLGATLMVCGAYQQATGQVRLTARFVKVESSEIIGAAKVDGKPSELLKLQDKVTAELLRSAGLGVHIKRITSRPRPELKSLKSVEFYGLALQIPEEEQRIPLLRAAVFEDAGFSYAVNDLKALEERLKKYQAVFEKAQSERAERLWLQFNQLIATKPSDAMFPLTDLFGRLTSTKQYYRLAKLSRAVLAMPAPAQLPLANPWDLAGNYLLISCQRIGDYDCLLREGEMLLKRFPTSAYFPAFKTTVEQAIARKRSIEAGKAQADIDAAKLSEEGRWDLCVLASIYDRQLQVQEALRLYRGCLAVGSRERGVVLRDAIFLAARNGEHAIARQLLADLEKAGPPALAKSVRDSVELPVDAPPEAAGGREVQP